MTPPEHAPSLFTPASLKFLAGLYRHNQKAWFEEHRETYERTILEPMKSLVIRLTPFLLSVDVDLEFRPAVNKTISRIHRDIRFSKNKSPYKTNQWITFKRPGPIWQERPGFFFEFGPGMYRYGMGFFAASKPTMDRMRNAIEKNPQPFLKRVKPLEKNWCVEGDQYQRLSVPQLPEPLEDWYRKKNLYLVHNRKPDRLLFSSKLADKLAEGFLELGKFYNYLWTLCRKA